MSKENIQTLTAENAKVLTEIAVDPRTPSDLLLKISAKLQEGLSHENFFQTIFEEGLSLGSCPKCGHDNHWAVPEDDLNQMGWAAHEKDERVPRHTTVKDCSAWREACKKKKIII